MMEQSGFTMSPGKCTRVKNVVFAVFSQMTTASLCAAGKVRQARSLVFRTFRTQAATAACVRNVRDTKDQVCAQPLAVGTVPNNLLAAWTTPAIQRNRCLRFQP